MAAKQRLTFLPSYFPLLYDCPISAEVHPASFIRPIPRSAICTISMLPRGQDQATSLIACTAPVSPKVVTTVSIGLTGAGLTTKTVRQAARSAARRIQALGKRRVTGAHSFSTDCLQEFDQSLELAATVTPQESSHPCPWNLFQKLTDKLSQLLAGCQRHTTTTTSFSQSSTAPWVTRPGNSIARGHRIREVDWSLCSVLRIYLWPAVISSNAMI
jgi:hypothetical protein